MFAGVAWLTVFVLRRTASDPAPSAPSSRCQFMAELGIADRALARIARES